MTLGVSNISCVRGHKPLFAPVSFSLQAGQALHVEGDNGVGKTSLLRIICGLSPADAGEVLWNGKALNRQHPEAVEAFRATLCYMGHNLSLKDELTALENLLFDAQVAGRSLSHDTAMDALKKMGLNTRAHLPLRVLSQGQKRRTALARLSVTDAKLWVLDEPFVALDAQSLDSLCVLLASHVQQGGMLLYTSHQAVALSQPHGPAVDIRPLRLVGA
jgi:heme exporter protein A